MFRLRPFRQISQQFVGLLQVWRADGYANGSDDELRKQAEHLSARLPSLYVIFAVNTLLIAVAFLDRSNLALSTIGPAIPVLIFIARARYWSAKRQRARQTSKIRTDLRALQFLGPTIVIIGMSALMALHQNASPLQQTVILYVFGVTTVAGILTLVDRPRTAMLGGLASSIPFTIVLAMEGQVLFALVVVAHLLTTSLLIKIAIGFYRDFEKTIKSERTLKKQKAEIEKNAAELQDLSSIDPLTGLDNRRTILSKAASRLEDLSAPSPWLVLLDLDGFKDINDQFGHAVGDSALQIIASRICAEKQFSDCGRIGGDEFALLIPGYETQDAALSIANELAKSIAEPMKIGNLALRVNASIGLRKTERLTLSECLERADFALFEAKRCKPAVVLFDRKHEKQLIDRANLTADFKNADLSNAIEVEFQPIFDFDEMRVVSVEALARWKRSADSVIMPHIFIELAETTGRISEITDTVIDKALRSAVTWPDDIDVQINLSAQDLRRTDLIERVHEAISSAGISSSRITFELTESVIIERRSQAVRVLEQLRSLGCGIALDDFGTGYSSLAYIDQFPLDQIKLDREFARKLSGDAPSTAVSSTIFALSQQLGVSCTFEGIETEKQALHARRLGFRRMQGFFFARPIKEVDLVPLLCRAGEEYSRSGRNWNLM